MRWHRSAPFLHVYRFLPHRLLNAAAAALGRARWPDWLVQAAIQHWTRRGGIDLQEFEPTEYRTVEEFFLRRLQPGRRPLGEGFVSPCDGTIIDAGTLTPDRRLQVKGQQLSVDRLVNGRHHALPLHAYQGGSYLVIFLSPDGYHRLHMPADGEIRGCQWIPGRYFPQNEEALRKIERVYERNERAVLRLVLDEGWELLLVLVGASLVGGIHLEGVLRQDWVQPRPVELALRRKKGEEIGYFSFGSTVVVIFPAGKVPEHTQGNVRMGDPLSIHR